MRDDTYDTALVRILNATVTAGDRDILNSVTLDITSGQPTVFLGPNGSGKTTLLKLAMGLLAPNSGSRDPRPDLRTAFVFQHPTMLRRTAAANIAFALQAAHRPPDHVTITALLDRVQLLHLKDRPARKFSGGEQQRLALARALALQPNLLFLDEPTASLDPAATKAVEDIIAAVAHDGVKIVMATHNLGQARRLAGDIVFLVGGKVLEHAATQTFFAAPATDAARRFVAGELLI